MTIEKSINDLTAAIIAHTDVIARINTCAPVAPVAAPVAPPAAPVAAPVAPPAAPVAAPVAPPAPPAPPVAPPAAPVAMTAEELNAALVVEFNRLGDRVVIDAVLKEFGATGVTDLPVEKYQELIDKVKAL